MALGSIFKRRTKAISEDAELELYRGIIEVPNKFEEGFTMKAVVGALFCGIIMVPGSIYLSLLQGGNMNVAASWVTLILFAEIARRSLTTLRKQEMIILLGVAGSMSAGGPLGEYIYRQFIIGSEAVREAGFSQEFPVWYGPAADSQALVERTFFHKDWVFPLSLMVGMMFIWVIRSYVSGYIFFRLASDIEKLPFPMASVGAAGSMALVEAGEKSQSWRWTVFSTGTIIGAGFAAIHSLIPLITGALLARPITLIPIPWIELTPMFKGILPAVALGVAIDLALVLIGFVVPFWAVMGAAAGVLITIIVNPILYHNGVLHTWKEGMETINTQIANQMDFWFSAGMGIALGLMLVSMIQTVTAIRSAMREAKGQGTGRSQKLQGGLATPPGRGDFPMKIAFMVYITCLFATFLLCYWLIRNPTPLLIAFLLLYIFLYAPMMAYLNARLVGICGQAVQVPFIREGMFILSGYKGLDVWVSPAIDPQTDAERDAGQAQIFRQLELTGTRFWSEAKARALTVPLAFVFSFFFWSFVWHTNAIPSPAFPYVEKMWELQVRSNMIMWSATMGAEGETTMFQEAFHPPQIILVCGLTVFVFLVFRWVGLPIMFIYGIIRGAGAFPHMLVLEIFGALLAKFHFHKKYGAQRFLQIAPVLLAGYMTGAGLIAMLGVAFALIARSVSSAAL